MRRIESIETFKEAEIKKPKTRDFYKALSKQLNEEVRPEIESERKQEYEGYSKEAKETLHNLETRFHFLDIKKKRHPLRFSILNRREYNRLFKRFKLSDRRIMLKEVDGSNIEIRNHSVQRGDSAAAIVVDEEVTLEKREKRKQIFEEKKLMSSPIQTAFRDIEIVQKQSTSKPELKRETTLVGEDDFNRVIPQDQQLSDNMNCSDDNRVTSCDESTKRYNIYGTLADKGIRGVYLTEEQKDVVEFVQNKQLYRDSTKNMWYVLAYLNMRGTYKKEKKKFERIILKDKAEETSKNIYLEEYQRKWNECMVEELNKEGGIMYELIKQVKYHIQDMKTYSEEKKYWTKKEMEYLKEIKVLVEKRVEIKEILEKYVDLEKDVEKRIEKCSRYEKDNREAIKVILEEVRKEFKSQADLVVTQMQPQTLEERARFLTQLYKYSETRVDDMIKAIRSGGNVLANFASQGAIALVDASVTTALHHARNLPY
ncbi:MAG TPA: hypothetical protein VK553_05070 [Candidatus Nitrosopolaris rasttigaisensis]|nr:hypothetical protein [Candidatus Nitrosopolaris rasttigaisensis]